METNPGLKHLAEKVFWNLDVEDLKICAQINQSGKQILENPIFWLKKFRSLSKENLQDWIKLNSNSLYNKIWTYRNCQNLCSFDRQS